MVLHLLYQLTEHSFIMLVSNKKGQVESKEKGKEKDKTWF